MVRRARRELGRAGVDRLEDRPDPEGVAQPADVVLAHPAADRGDLDVGEAVPLGPPQRAGVELRCRIAQLGRRPRGAAPAGRGTTGRSPVASCSSSVVAPARIACTTACSRRSCGRPARASHSSLSPTGDAEVELGALGLQRAHRLLQRLGEAAAERHHLADALHVRRQGGVGAGELLEGEPRDLHHDVVEARLEARRRLGGDVVRDLVEGVAERELRGDLRDREAGRLADASALDRDTRGFISMTTCRPVVGSTANWMLEPPVSTPTSRMTANAMSRSCWYSRSVSVIAGATVMESPVCTPIGSRFSIEQTTTQLSLRSRITSSSYSFQPSTLSSTSTSWTGLACRPAADHRGAARPRRGRSPSPPPPRVNDGRSTSG